MAMMDTEIEFATAHAPTTGSNISTNTWKSSPLGGSPDANGGRDLGAGRELFLNILVKTAADSSGDGASVEFKLMTHTTATVTSGSTLVSTGAIAQATLVAGHHIVLPLPRGTYKEYIGVVAVISGENLTAGQFAYFITETAQDKKAYAGGFALDQ